MQTDTKTSAGLSRLRTILLTGAASMVVAVFAVLVYLHAEQDQMARERWTPSTRPLAEALAKQINTELDYAQRSLQMLAGGSEFQSLPYVYAIDPTLNGIPDGLDAGKRRMIDLLMNNNSMLSVVFLLLPNGDHYISHPYSVQLGLQQYNLAHRDYFRAVARDRETVVSDGFIGADGQLAVAIDTPILKKDNQILAHLGAVYHLSSLSQLLAPGNIGLFDQAFILDRSGHLIAHSDGRWLSKTGRQEFLQGPLMQALDQNRATLAQGILLSNKTLDKDYLGVAVTLDTGWQLVVLSDWDQMVEAARDQLFPLPLVIIGILVITFSTGLFFIARISQRWQKAEAEVIAVNSLLEQRVEQRTRELSESNERFHALADSIQDVFWVGDTDDKYRVRYVNPAFERIWQRSVEELYRRPDIWHKCIHPEDKKRALKGFDRLIKTSDFLDIEFRIVRPGGEIRDIWVRGHSVRNEEGGLIHIAGIAQDITELNQAQKQVRLLSMAVEQSPVSVVITDPDARIQYVNKAFEETSGYRFEEVKGENPRILKSEYTPHRRHQQLWKTISSGQVWHGELRNRKKSGELFWEQAHIGPVLDEDGKVLYFLGIKEDISLQKEQQERILYQSHYDALTGLPNRFLTLDRLSDKLKAVKRNSDPLAVLFLDIDDFKKVNDALGHDLGDKLLTEAASRLVSVVRAEDTVGRLGGDEFAVILSDFDRQQDASLVAEKILATFRKPFNCNGRELRLTVSVGIAQYPQDGDEAPILLRAADTAMFHSKEMGRNVYHYFTDTMNQQVARRLLLEEQLHTALERDELYVLFQPIVELSSGQMVGVEALLRWKNPTLGMVSPEEFIDVAEHTGLILPIGYFVLEQSLAMAAHWEASSEFTVSVNVSPRQFRDGSLASRINKMLRAEGLQGECLKLEITEGVLMGSQAEIEKNLQAIRAQGVSIVMDDFGTGYSSLSYLRTYPFDTLKIDRSFIRDIQVDPADKELVLAALSMAHALGMKVVAEGIETEQQLSFLRDAGCLLGQGWLFGKPQTPDQLFPPTAELSSRQ